MLGRPIHPSPRRKHDHRAMRSLASLKRSALIFSPLRNPTGRGAAHRRPPLPEAPKPPQSATNIRPHRRDALPTIHFTFTLHFLLRCLISASTAHSSPSLQQASIHRDRELIHVSLRLLLHATRAKSCLSSCSTPLASACSDHFCRSRSRETAVTARRVASRIVIPCGVYEWLR